MSFFDVNRPRSLIVQAGQNGTGTCISSVSGKTINEDVEENNLPIYGRCSQFKVLRDGCARI